ncbi:MAG TPA: cytochrome B6, partial [Geomonas sp.]|nr:cytochrome B6 [Geomonas sp.]
MRKHPAALFSLLVASGLMLIATESRTLSANPPQQAPFDAAADAQTPREVPKTRPEQQMNQHDSSGVFDATNADPSSTAFKAQPDEGKILGFEFYRDPLDAKKPMMTFEEVYQKDVADKPKVMATQRRVLESRYDLTPHLSPDVKMTRGKPIAVGPTARLPQGLSWDRLTAMSPEAIRRDNFFPYPPLPHPKQATGGQVFPKVQTDMFPRLQRFDVDFDIPDAFLP